MDDTTISMMIDSGNYRLEVMQYLALMPSEELNDLLDEVRQIREEMITKVINPYIFRLSAIKYLNDFEGREIIINDNYKLEVIMKAPVVNESWKFACIAGNPSWHKMT